MQPNPADEGMVTVITRLSVFFLNHEAIFELHCQI